MPKTKQLPDNFNDVGYGNIQILHRVKRWVASAESEFQRIQIFDTDTFGRVLALDGILQTTTGDEFVYHEMMAHVPMIAHGFVRDVLIIGGGDGGVLREVLKYNIDRVTLVELDDAVIDMTAKYMPALSMGAFKDRRVQLQIGDGAKFIDQLERSVDVIIVDSTDRVGPSRALYTSSFYRSCARRLKPKGILINQNGIPFLWPKHISLTAQRRRTAFRNVGLYLAPVPSFFGGYQAFGWASNGWLPGETSILSLQKRFRSQGITPKYYSPEIHQRSFILPPFIEGML